MYLFLYSSDFSSTSLVYIFPLVHFPICSVSTLSPILFPACSPCIYIFISRFIFYFSIAQLPYFPPSISLSRPFPPHNPSLLPLFPFPSFLMSPSLLPSASRLPHLLPSTCMQPRICLRLHRLPHHEHRGEEWAESGARRGPDKCPPLGVTLPPHRSWHGESGGKVKTGIRVEGV